MSQTMSLVLYFAVFFGIMYFLMIRPQQKQAKQREALLNGIRVRDRVITVGGIYGKIIKVKENSVILQIADKVEVELAKSGITSVENRNIVIDNDKKNGKGVKGGKEEKVIKDETEVKSEPETEGSSGTI